MSKIVFVFFIDMLKGFTIFSGKGLIGLAEKPFAIEKTMGQYGLTQFPTIFNTFITIGISLIVVKFLKKGFDTYVLWTDGDADADPVQLVINFFLAMITAITFAFLYSYFVEILIEVIGDILDVMGTETNIVDPFSGNIITQIIEGNDLTLIGLLGYMVFFIMVIILEIKLIGIGLEMLVLRIGAPLACSGLMDADKGVFKSYMQKFLQVGLTILVQITMTKLAIILLIQGDLLYGLATAYFAITTPNFIKEFLIPSGGGGMNNLYQGARLAQMIGSFVK